MKTMKENDIESVKDVVLCFFFPFALFWGGDCFGVFYTVPV